MPTTEYVRFESDLRKDTKFIAKRYEDYASAAIDEISDYFTYLHGALQNIERSALFTVREGAMKVLSRVNQTQSELKKGQETLDEILVTLESTISQPPAHNTIGKLIDKTNTILEAVPCNIEFDGVNSNPFVFIKMRKAPVEFPNLYELQVRTDEFRPRIFSYFGETNSMEQSMDYASCSMNSNSKNPSESFHAPRNLPNLEQAHQKQKQEFTRKKKPYWKQNKTQNQPQPFFDNQSRSSLDGMMNPNSSSNTSLFNLKSSTIQKVHVSHIKNPENFYVQMHNHLPSQTGFRTLMMEEAEFAPTPDYIDLSEMYLVFNPADHKWYRAQVLNNISTDLYMVFLVDYGNSIQMPKQRFRIISETLRAKPYSAIQCSLYGIKPIRNEWNDKANQLMSEIIMNEIVHMVIYKEDTVYQVDLVTTHLTYPTSVRNALVFADLAVEDVNLPSDMQKRIQQLSSVRKSLLTPPSEKFYKYVFKEGESFRGLILNVISPHDFYAMKYEHKSVMENLFEELNNDYQQPQQKLFTPLVNIPCAVYVGSHWHRAKITEIKSKSKISVWLVDSAESHTVPYAQLRALQQKYLVMNECAIQCSLADIEPLQRFGYSWTPNSVIEFKRIIQNPVLQIIVHRTQNFLHQIVLYIIKKNMDINVNALLVDYKHANSTGSESQYVEYPKLSEIVKADDDILNEISLMEMTISDKHKEASNARSKVKVCHIVSPGEFYLTKVENYAAITRFHEEIQLSRNKDDLAPAKPYENQSDQEEEMDAGWDVGNCCLVRLRLKEDNPIQWYRGMVKKITEYEGGNKYTVFLRDHGKTIEDICPEDMAPIPGLYNRVCDGAIKCHLACIQPTGGLSAWSGASIDEFKAATLKFKELAASIQGERAGDSIPVIVWGLKQECPDPLAPTIYKWVNINRCLSNAGLAHLAEKFTPISENNALKTNIQNGEKSFQEWVANLNKVVDRTSKDDTSTLTILKHDDDSDITEEEAHFDPDGGSEFVTWLPAKEVTKTIFMGIPTFVDNDGVIYLYDASKKQIFDNIIVVVNKVVKSSKTPLADSFWYTGQPCLAQYTVDGKFYRAIIQETKPDKRVIVQFVDYGNVQECSTKDLRKQVVLTQIPIQVTKYKLDGILPPEGKVCFSLDAMDFLYANIVNKECAVRVSNNQLRQEVKLCSLKCGPLDIADLMIDAGFGRKSRPNSATSIFLETILSSGKTTATVKQPAKTAVSEHKQETNSKSSSKKKQIFDDDDDDDIIIEDIIEKRQSPKHTIEDDEHSVAQYKELFEKLQLDHLHRAKENSSESDSHEENMEIERTYTAENLAKNIEMTSPADKNDKDNEAMLGEEFIPLIDHIDAADTTPSSFEGKVASTSTKISKIKKTTSFEPFQILTIPESTRTFNCEVTFIFDALTIAIHPLLPEHKKVIFELTKDLQIAAALAPNIKTFDPNTPCLAMFSEDNLWYRATIRTYNPNENLVEVVFVDFFNAEWVPAKKVRVCPSDLISVPLRSLLVKLAGVKPNRRWRNDDIKRKFSELVDDRNVFVKIIGYEDSMPVVELYEDGDTDDLLYEVMIKERFYLQE